MHIKIFELQRDLVESVPLVLLLIYTILWNYLQKIIKLPTCDAVNQKLGIVHFWDTLNFLHFSGTIIFYANNFK